jgi:hypothetical protein
MEMKTPEQMAFDWWADYSKEKDLNKWDTVDPTVGFLAGYQAAAPQWISVKERLPEEGSGLLIVYHSYLKEVGTSYYDDDMWCSSPWPITCEHITHWMPLPQPPKDPA